jgi:hypothetical protein
VTLIKLKRVRWGVRGALALGVAASIAGNVLHAQDDLISRVISAWSPLALLITIELIARVPVHRKELAAARWLATAVIAGIAAWVSYWHMAAVASRYGETGASPYLIPLSVDGLVVVASVCLVELGGRIRDAESPGHVDMLSTPDARPAAPSEPGPADDHADPIGPKPGTGQVDKLSTPRRQERKAPPTAKERVERAHRRTPDASDKALAERLNLHPRTVARHRPEKPAESASQEQINGREPELAAATTGAHTQGD